MLRRIIVSSYGVLLEVSIWLILLGSFLGGWYASGFGTAIIALIVAAIFSAVFFGGFLTLLDIRKSLLTIEKR